MSAVSPDIDDFKTTRAVTLNPLLHGAHRLAELMVDGGTIIAISSNGPRAAIPTARSTEPRSQRRYESRAVTTASASRA